MHTHGALSTFAGICVMADARCRRLAIEVVTGAAAAAAAPGVGVMSLLGRWCWGVHGVAMGQERRCPR